MGPLRHVVACVARAIPRGNQDDFFVVYVLFPVSIQQLVTTDNPGWIIIAPITVLLQLYCNWGLVRAKYAGGQLAPPIIAALQLRRPRHDWRGLLFLSTTAIQRSGTVAHSAFYTRSCKAPYL